MAEMKKRPTVILVSAKSLEVIMTPGKGVVEARYVRERDEPAFQRTWERISRLKAQGQLKPVPAPPAGGIRLRGRRTKQIA